MKIKVFLVLALLGEQFECKRTLQPDFYFKWLRASCTSSNISVTNVKCGIRPLSRSAQNVSGSYTVKIPVDEIFVSFDSYWPIIK
jgi:hypothetical protein